MDIDPEIYEAYTERFYNKVRKYSNLGSDLEIEDGDHDEKKKLYSDNRF